MIRFVSSIWAFETRKLNQAVIIITGNPEQEKMSRGNTWGEDRIIKIWYGDILKGQLKTLQTLSCYIYFLNYFLTLYFILLLITYLYSLFSHLGLQPLTLFYFKLAMDSVPCYHK